MEWEEGSERGREMAKMVERIMEGCVVLAAVVLASCASCVGCDIERQSLASTYHTSAAFSVPSAASRLPAAIPLKTVCELRSHFKLHASSRRTLLHLRMDSSSHPKAPPTPKALPQPGGPSTLALGSGAQSGLPAPGRPFTVLGIETSCDDTAVAVVRSDGTVLGEAIAKQDAIHERWGGVVPGLARAAHEDAVNDMVQLALVRAFGESATAADVDAIAATVGPGMEICLRVGAAAGRRLALEHSKPFVGVHHLEAHCL